MTIIVKFKFFQIENYWRNNKGKERKKRLFLRHVSLHLKMDVALLNKIERSERKATKEQIIKLADMFNINKEFMLIQYLSDKIICEFKNEELGLKALKAAERKLNI